MAYGGEATILLPEGGGRPVACNEAALALLGCDADTFASLAAADLAPLRTPGRHDLVLPGGSVVTVEVTGEDRWWADGPARLIVARAAGDHNAAPVLPAAVRDRLLRALEAHEAGAPVGAALLFVDVAGDEQVAAAAEDLLHDAVRRNDLVTAVGPGRFVVLCEPVYGEIDAAGMAASLVDEIGLLTPGVEIGVAVPGDPGMSVAALLADEAAAIAAARTQGRARHAAFSAAADVRNRRQAAVAHALRRALDAGEVDVHYQPVVDLTDGAVHTFEALARWHPRGVPAIPPDRFIPVAERTGLIGELGESVLRAACDFVVDRPGLRVAVNLSPHQVDGELLERVGGVLDQTGLDADRLELELTESAFLDDPDTATDVLRTIADRGVRLALDDFGTGYSSLLVLRRLPFDRLKVDRSFVRAVADTDADRELVGAVVSLARAVGVAVTAEGVETEEQAQVLADLGCDDAQGFLFARPMDGAACDDWLAMR